MKFVVFSLNALVISIFFAFLFKIDKIEQDLCDIKYKISKIETSVWYLEDVENIYYEKLIKGK